MSLLYLKLLFILLIIITFKTMAYEEAPYSIVFQNDIYEVRNYNNRLAVQVNFTDQSKGFRRLFNYISGFNNDSTKINMTIPATQSYENGSQVMQFYFPSNFTKENAPLPNDNELSLINIEQGFYAVIKYKGRLTDKNFHLSKNILKNSLFKDNIEILSSAIRATYNGPFTLPFLRRNEVMFHVSWKG